MLSLIGSLLEWLKSLLGLLQFCPGHASPRWCKLIQMATTTIFIKLPACKIDRSFTHTSEQFIFNHLHLLVLIWAFSSCPHNLRLRFVTIVMLVPVIPFVFANLDCFTCDAWVVDQTQHILCNILHSCKLFLGKHLPGVAVAEICLNCSRQGAVHSDIFFRQRWGKTSHKSDDSVFGSSINRKVEWWINSSSWERRVRILLVCWTREK